MSDRIAVMNDGVVEQLADAARALRAPGHAVRRRLHRHLQPARAARRPARRRAGRDGPRRRPADPRAPIPGDGRGRAADHGPPGEDQARDGAVPDGCVAVAGTVADVVYLGSMTQLIVELRTGERLSVHRLNDDDGRADPGAGDHVTLHWAAEHSFVIGGASARRSRAEAGGELGSTDAPQHPCAAAGAAQPASCSSGGRRALPGAAPRAGAVRGRPQAGLHDRGRRRQRLPRLHLGLGVGAARRRPRGRSIEPAVEALRRYGNEDSHSIARATCAARRAPARRSRRAA